jgi:hypothetical protein
MSLRCSGFLLLLSSTLAQAGYRSLIATSDGLSVHFTYQQTPAAAGSVAKESAAKRSAGNLIDCKEGTAHPLLAG